MKRLGRSLLAAYLGVFALLARDPEDARAERRLLLGSIEYSYRELLRAGRRSSVAGATALWRHLGELQPLAVLARVGAANREAARAGIGGRRVVERRLSLPTAAALAALVVWGANALGWIFLAFAIAALGITSWTARHSGARWLIPLVPLLMIWPLVARRMSTDRGSVAINEALAASLLLFIALAAHALWRGRRTLGEDWRDLGLLAAAPLWWTAGYAVYAQIDRFLLPDGYFGSAVAEARFGLPVDETMFALGLAAFTLAAAYWVLLGLLTARVANWYRATPPAEDDSTSEAIWL